jgi:hypothetical protein
MIHFAKVNKLTNMVEDVTYASQEWIDENCADDEVYDWIQTCSDTRGSVYYTPNTHDVDPDQSKALRANFACIGGTYNREHDVFISTQPFPYWKLDENFVWQPPVPYPNDDKKYYWDMTFTNWKEIPIFE